LLCGLDIPLVTRLCDSQRYIQAISTGRSLYELPGRQGKAERERWRTLVDWLAHSLYPDRQPPPRVDAKVPRVQPGTFWEGTGNPRTVVDASGRMSLEA
jgi:hypothetical protein